MKKTMIVCTAVLGALLFAACNKLETVSQEPEVKMATLTADIRQDTKTTLDGVSVKWSADDALAVFSNDDYTKTEYVSNNTGTNTTHAVFIGEPKTGTRFLATYPSSRSSFRAETNYINVRIPDSQTYVENGIANNLLPMYATGTSLENMTFDYLGGVLRIRLWASTTTKVSEIKLTANELVSTNHMLDIDVNTNGNFTYYGGSGSTYSITLNCPSPVTLGDEEHPTEFNIVYMPFSVSTGFVVKVTADAGVMYLTKTGSFTFARGKVTGFNAKEFEVSAADPTKQASLDGENWSPLATFGGKPEPNLYVKTAENPLNSIDLATIKTIIGRSDSYNVVLDMSASTYENTTFPNGLMATNKLQEITLPSNITTLGLQCFKNCSHLSSIFGLNHVTAISGQSFDFTAFTSLHLPASVTSIPENGWIAYRTTSLTEFTVAAENPRYKAVDGAIYVKDAGGNATKLVEFPKGRGPSHTVPEGVTSMDEYAFGNIQALTTLRLPSTLATLNFISYEPPTMLTSIRWDRDEPGTIVGSSFLPENGTLTVPDHDDIYKAYFGAWSWLTTKHWTVNGHASAD